MSIRAICILSQESYKRRFTPSSQQEPPVSAHISSPLEAPAPPNSRCDSSEEEAELLRRGIIHGRRRRWPSPRNLTYFIGK